MPSREIAFKVMNQLEKRVEKDLPETENVERLVEQRCQIGFLMSKVTIGFLLCKPYQSKGLRLCHLYIYKIDKKIENSKGK